jgi:hypothetical protein
MGGYTDNWQSYFTWAIAMTAANRRARRTGRRHRVSRGVDPVLQREMFMVVPVVVEPPC